MSRTARGVIARATKPPVALVATVPPEPTPGAAPHRLDWFDRKMLTFVLAWVPYGGAPDDESFVEFGLNAAETWTRFVGIVARMTCGHAEQDSPADAALLRRAMFHVARQREPHRWPTTVRSLPNRSATLPPPPPRSAESRRRGAESGNPSDHDGSQRRPRDTSAVTDTHLRKRIS